MKCMLDPRKIDPRDWEYFAINETVTFARRYQDEQSGIFELVIVVSTLDTHTRIRRPVLNTI